MAMSKRHNEILERLDETNERLSKIEKQLAERPAAESTEVKTLEDLGLSESQVKALQDAGYGSPIQLRAIPDETLGAVKGIGPKAVKEIREKLG